MLGKAGASPLALPKYRRQLRHTIHGRLLFGRN